jgi:hypothetical protein
MEVPEAYLHGGIGKGLDHFLRTWAFGKQWEMACSYDVAD